MQVELLQEGKGNVYGIVFDATTQSQTPISDVTVKVRSGWNNTTGDVIKTVSTNTSGTYVLEELEADHYTLEISKSGYTTTTVNITAVANQQRSFSTPLSPLIIASKYRTVFTWGANPGDLDAHLVCILPDGTTRYHVYYGNKNAQDSTGNNIANLDVDITTGNGHETLTFDVEIENTYLQSNNTDANFNSSIIGESEAATKIKETRNALVLRK